MNSNKLILLIVAVVVGLLMINKINNVNILLLSGIVITGCIITKFTLTRRVCDSFFR